MSTSVKWNLPAGRLIAPERVPEGFLFTDRHDAFSWGKFIFGGIWLLIWCGASFPIFIGSLLVVLARPSLGAILFLLFISIFVVVGVIGLTWGIRWLNMTNRLEPGQVILPSYPLRLGESSQLRYRRRLRRGLTPKTGRVTAEWLCYEWVQYRRGTDIETKTHTLWTTDLPETSVEIGSRWVEYETQIMAAPHCPPSFDASHNQVRWEIRVKIDLPGVAKDTSFFRFRVMPEVMG